MKITLLSNIFSALPLQRSIDESHEKWLRQVRAYQRYVSGYFGTCIPFCGSAFPLLYYNPSIEQIYLRKAPADLLKAPVIRVSPFSSRGGCCPNLKPPSISIDFLSIILQPLSNSYWPKWRRKSQLLSNNEKKSQLEIVLKWVDTNILNSTLNQLQGIWWSNNSTRNQNYGSKQ